MATAITDQTLIAILEVDASHALLDQYKRSDDVNISLRNIMEVYKVTDQNGVTSDLAKLYFKNGTTAINAAATAGALNTAMAGNGYAALEKGTIAYLPTANSGAGALSMKVGAPGTDTWKSVLFA